MRRVLLTAGLLLCSVAASWGSEAHEVARQVLEAHARGDRVALQRLARGGEPDPWIVADALLGRGHAQAALEFARAAPRADTAGLPRYVQRRVRAAGDAGARTALAAAQVHARRAAWAEVVDVARRAACAASSVPCWRLRMLEAAALAALDRHVQAADRLEDLGAELRGAGWLAMAAQAYSQAGLAHVRAERWSGAVRALDALAALEESRANDAGAAAAYLRLGFAYESRGDGTLAIESVERSRTLAERTGAEGAAARAWSSLGRLYHVHGRDPRRALAALERAVERLAAVDEAAPLAHALIELGLVRRRCGDLAGAAAAHERAYRVLRTLRDRAGMAVALSGLGGMCIRRGEYARALACLEEAKGLMHALGNRRGEAVVLAQLGELYAALSDAPAAQACFERSLALAADSGDAATAARAGARAADAAGEATDGEAAAPLLEQALGCLPDGCDREACASILRRLGSLHLVQGEHGQALARHRGALAQAEASGDPLQVIASLVELAALRRAMGTFEAALALDARAVQLASRSGSHEALARSLWSRAASHLQHGAPAAALDDARRAVRAAAQVCTRLPEFEGSRTGDLWRGLYEVGVLAAMRLDSVHDAAWFLEAGRAGMLLASLGGREALASHVVPAALRAEEARARAAEASALAAHRRAWRLGRLDEVRAARRDLERARADTARIVLRIRREARGAGRLLCLEPDDLATLQQRLAPDEALVLYALMPRHVLALVATPTSARLVDLGLRRTVEQAVAALDVQAAGTPTGAACTVLQDLLVRPLALPPGVRRLRVSPMGSLGLLPPALLFPRHVVAYVPSGTILGVLAQDGAVRGEGVLALGDPDYQGWAPRGYLPPPPASRWPPLPATRAEVLSVGDVCLLGDEATPTHFLTALGSRPRWRAVHLACHGRAFERVPLASALAMAPGPGDDGLLTALDLLDVRIPADLAVLSACETGRGGVYDVEGVVGLARAFMLAGAPRVVCSLWRVDDDATRVLMERFHALWRDEDGGRGAAWALREAQAHVRSHPAWRHPTYWAGWVLWGLAD